ncbi:ABC transporter ATP-binding protein, partial [Candidatus Saccharibacteria bacterium]|nr:ABC transporter ATP-binding protein [Candidatus Saccharibacteria bacterium]NIW79631.1 ABC transporter ATP-binding protein [Calditrichia bacterium]
MEKIGSLEMVVNEFEVLERHREQSGNRPIEELKEGIELRDVKFGYDNSEENVLKSVNIDIP